MSWSKRAANGRDNTRHRRAYRAGTRERRMLARLSTWTDADAVVTVPSVVVAEWWRGQKGPAARLLDAFTVEPMSRALVMKAAALEFELPRVATDGVRASARAITSRTRRKRPTR